MKNIMNHPAEIEAFAIHLAELEKQGYFLGGFICGHRDQSSKLLLMPSQLIAHHFIHDEEKGRQFLESMCAMIQQSSPNKEVTIITKRGESSLFKSDN